MRFNPFRRKIKANQHELMQSEHFEYIEGVEIFPCWGCGQKTNRVELNYGAHICSVGCRQIVDIRTNADLIRMAKAAPDYPEDKWWDDFDTEGSGYDRSIYEQ
jgi:hypothetical protein